MFLFQKNLLSARAAMLLLAAAPPRTSDIACRSLPHHAAGATSGELSPLKLLLQRDHPKTAHTAEQLSKPL
jgi:hypothetical protein